MTWLRSDKLDRPVVPRGHVKRGDPRSVRSLLEAASAQLDLLRKVEVSLDQRIVAARAAGATWQQIADVLGMTPKSAWKRYAAA